MCLVQMAFAGTRLGISEHQTKQASLWPHSSVTYQDVLVLAWACMHS